jgi:hypothetical protein
MDVPHVPPPRDELDQAPRMDEHRFQVRVGGKDLRRMFVGLVLGDEEPSVTADKCAQLVVDVCGSSREVLNRPRH